MTVYLTSRGHMPTATSAAVPVPLARPSVVAMLPLLARGPPTSSCSFPITTAWGSEMGNRKVTMCSSTGLFWRRGAGKRRSILSCRMRPGLLKTSWSQVNTSQAID